MPVRNLIIRLPINTPHSVADYITRYIRHLNCNTKEARQVTHLEHQFIIVSYENVIKHKIKAINDSIVIGAILRIGTIKRERKEIKINTLHVAFIEI